MYQIKSHINIFSGKYVKTYYRDGVEIGYAVDGVMRLSPRYKEGVAALTRAQGYKYWGKYFPRACADELPQILQDAINKPLGY